jgi:hypothetical protein
MMGIGRPPAEGWQGPGTAYPDSYGEMTQTHWYTEWLEWMGSNGKEAGV